MLIVDIVLTPIIFRAIHMQRKGIEMDIDTNLCEPAGQWLIKEAMIDQLRPGIKENG